MQEDYVVMGGILFPHIYMLKFIVYVIISYMRMVFDFFLFFFFLAKTNLFHRLLWKEVCSWSLYV